MVRLREKYTSEEMKVILEFQFLYGSIERKLMPSEYLYLSPNFNSYMVRLRVTIRIWIQKKPSYFNSYMVRLRAESLEPQPDDLPLFQFLYGSIESFQDTSTFRGKL